jgi:hypothetical protein
MVPRCFETFGLKACLEGYFQAPHTQRRSSGWQRQLVAGGTPHPRYTYTPTVPKGRYTHTVPKGRHTHTVPKGRYTYTK